jgi:hypothetical protein
MIGWIQYLVYIISFVFPPFGFVTFWVFSGREEELRFIGRWSMLAAFVGVILWCIIAASFGMAPGRYFWPGMGGPMWR